MTRYKAEQKAKKEYGNCRLFYKIISEEYFAEQNKKNFEKMKEALDAVGVMLKIDNGELTLAIYPEKYIRTKERNAGRRKKIVWNEESRKKGKYETYKYSDIVFMMQTMMDKEIANKIGMPIATYYRHKKTLKESYYFNSLDLNKLQDKEYLESVSDNLIF